MADIQPLAFQPPPMGVIAQMQQNEENARHHAMLEEQAAASLAQQKAQAQFKQQFEALDAQSKDPNIGITGNIRALQQMAKMAGVPVPPPELIAEQQTFFRGMLEAKLAGDPMKEMENYIPLATKYPNSTFVQKAKEMIGPMHDEMVSMGAQEMGKRLGLIPKNATPRQAAAQGELIASSPGSFGLNNDQHRLAEMKIEQMTSQAGAIKLQIQDGNQFIETMGNMQARDKDFAPKLNVSPLASPTTDAREYAYNQAAQAKQALDNMDKQRRHIDFLLKQRSDGGELPEGQSELSLQAQQSSMARQMDVLRARLDYFEKPSPQSFAKMERATEDFSRKQDELRSERDRLSVGASDIRAKALADKELSGRAQSALEEFYFQSLRDDGSNHVAAARIAINKVRKLFPDAAIDATKLKSDSGGIKVSVNAFENELSKLNAKALDTGRSAAFDAQEMIATVHRGRDLLNEGVITGTGAGFITEFGNALKTIGIDEAGDATANTQAFVANMAQNVGKNIKQFGSGTGLSDADREYATQMAGGKIAYTEQSIRKILDIQEKQGRWIIQRQNKMAGNVKTEVPLTVEEPAPYQPKPKQPAKPSMSQQVEDILREHGIVK